MVIETKQKANIFWWKEVDATKRISLYATGIIITDHLSPLFTNRDYPN